MGDGRTGFVAALALLVAGVLLSEAPGEPDAGGPPPREPGPQSSTGLDTSGVRLDPMTTGWAMLFAVSVGVVLLFVVWAKRM